MAIRPSGYYELKHDKNLVQFWQETEWDTKIYAKDSVREHYRSNGWPVPVFLTTEQATELATYRSDKPAGGNGWYTEPTDSIKVRYWNGEWASVAYTKSQVISNYRDNKLIPPVFDPKPVAVVETTIETPIRAMTSAKV